MSSREYRNVPGALLEVRMTPDGRSGRVVADVMKYNVVDDYRTAFYPGCFTQSLEQRMPRILWAHNPTDPIGQWLDAEDTRDRLRLAGQLDLQMIPGTNTPAVPSAHRAWAQLDSRTIDQFSVGFLRQGEERNTPFGQGVVGITKALLDEASPVLVGSVPGAQLVAVRAANTFESNRKLVFFPSRALELRAAGKGGQFAKGGGRVPGSGGGGGKVTAADAMKVSAMTAGSKLGAGGSDEGNTKAAEAVYEKYTAEAAAHRAKHTTANGVHWGTNEEGTAALRKATTLDGKANGAYSMTKKAVPDRAAAEKDLKSYKLSAKRSMRGDDDWAKGRAEGAQEAFDARFGSQRRRVEDDETRVAGGQFAKGGGRVPGAATAKSGPVVPLNAAQKFATKFGGPGKHKGVAMPPAKAKGPGRSGSQVNHGGNLGKARGVRDELGERAAAESKKPGGGSSLKRAYYEGAADAASFVAKPTTSKPDAAGYVRSLKSQMKNSSDSGAGLNLVRGQHHGAAKAYQARWGS